MKVGVFYASMSGNTEAIADAIVENLKARNLEVHLHDLVSISSAQEFLAYDLTYVGMYTWGDGDVPDECLDIVEELEEMDLSGQHFALFGSGDTSYPEFCGALDKMKELVEAQGGVIAGNPLRIEYEPSKADEEEIKDFVSQTVTIFETSR